MSPQIVCKQCNSANPARSQFCKFCGSRLPVRSLLTKISWFGWSAAMLAWSLFTINLVAVTQPMLFPSQKGPVIKDSVNTGAVIDGPVNGPVVNFPDNKGHVEVRFYSPPPKPVKPHEVQRDDFVPDVTDSKGAHASFIIYLFSDEYKWRLGSWEELETGETRIPFTQQMQTNLNSAVEVICVGASSEEIRPGLSDEDGRREEESRARRRSETIAMWIRPQLFEHVRVRKLNIGYHTPERLLGQIASETSDQRRIIIVLVLKEEDDVDLDSALRKSFEIEGTKHPIYETILTKYSLTKAARFTWLD